MTPPTQSAMHALGWGHSYGQLCYGDVICQQCERGINIIYCRPETANLDMTTC